MDPTLLGRKSFYHGAASSSKLVFLRSRLSYFPVFILRNPQFLKGDIVDEKRNVVIIKIVRQDVLKGAQQ